MTATVNIVENPLYDRYLRAVAGEKLPPAKQWEDGQGGTVNFKGLECGSAVELGRPGAEARMLAFLAEQQQVGHLSLVGPNGAQCETGSPHPHYPMNLQPMAGTLRTSIKRGLSKLEEALLRWFGAEFAFNAAFRVGGKIGPPAGRVKRQKKQSEADPWRDNLHKLIAGEKFRMPEDGVSALSFECLKFALAGDAGAERRKSIVTASFPKLLVPIHRQELEGGGYAAWIPQAPVGTPADKLVQATQERRKLLLLSGSANSLVETSLLDFVVVRPGRETLRGFDWDTPVPELPDAVGPVEVLGL